METYILPHFATNGDWWTGFDIFNFNNEDASINLTFYDSLGKPVHSEEKIIKAKQSYLFTDTEIYEKIINKSIDIRRLIVNGPKGLLITCMQGNGEGTFNHVPFYKASELKN